MKKREIKFRGKSLETGKWVYGGILLWNGMAAIIQNEFCLNDNWQIRKIKVDIKTVGQFTGMYDNTKWEELTNDEKYEFSGTCYDRKEDWKGKEIYEGSAVKLIYSDNSSEEFIVGYNSDKARFVLSDVANEEWGFDVSCEIKVI